MNLKIVVPETNNFRTGAAANVFLDGVDVSRFVARVELTVDAREAICAEVTFYPTALEIDLPATVVAMQRQALVGQGD